MTWACFCAVCVWMCVNITESVSFQIRSFEPLYSNKCVVWSGASETPNLMTDSRKWCVSLMWMLCGCSVCLCLVCRLCFKPEKQRSLFVLMSCCHVSKAKTLHTITSSVHLLTIYFLDYCCFALVGFSPLILDFRRDVAVRSLWRHEQFPQAVCKLSMKHHRLYLDYLNEKNMYALYNWKYTYVLKGCLSSCFLLKRHSFHLFDWKYFYMKIHAADPQHTGFCLVAHFQFFLKNILKKDY